MLNTVIIIIIDVGDFSLDTSSQLLQGLSSPSARTVHNLPSFQHPIASGMFPLSLLVFSTIYICCYLWTVHDYICDTFNDVLYKGESVHCQCAL